VTLLLQLARLLAWPLEFNEQRPTSRDQEDPVRPAAIPAQVELEAGNAQALSFGDDPLLDVSFKYPHR